jgi:hypothetical protein
VCLAEGLSKPLPVLILRRLGSSLNIKVYDETGWSMFQI